MDLKSFHNWVFALGLLGSGAPGLAEGFQPMDMDQLTRKAEIVLHAKVLGSQCQQDAEGRVYTRIELQVHEVWKGSVKSSPFVVVHGGGSLQGRHTVISGQVEYSAGDEVVAFLVLNQRQEGVTLGLAQGKFSVWTDSATGKQMVGNQFHGSLPPQAQKMGATATPSSSPVSLADLRKRVQGARP